MVERLRLSPLTARKVVERQLEGILLPDTGIARCRVYCGALEMAELCREI
jgi:hypothetical protein